MTDIQLGLKLWSINTDVLNEAKSLIKEGVFQYIELRIVPGTDPTLFQQLEVPYILHAPTDREVNLGDFANKERVQEMFNTCETWAQTLSASFVILHPGFGDLETAKQLLQEVQDERFLLENMPKAGLHGQSMIGYDVSQLKLLFGEKLGFCLDLNHAMRAARSLNRDEKEFAKELLDLNPKVLHVTDGDFKEADEHQKLGEGEYDLSFFAECVRKVPDAFVTLETPRKDLHSLVEDREEAEKFRKLL